MPSLGLSNRLSRQGLAGRSIVSDGLLTRQLFNSDRIEPISAGVLQCGSGNDFLRTNTNSTNNEIFSGDFTLMAWVKTPDGDFSGDDCIMGVTNNPQEDRFYFNLDANNTVTGTAGSIEFFYEANNDYFSCISDRVFYTCEIPWDHIAITIKKSTATNGANIYLNGNLIKTGASDGVSTENWEAWDNTDYIAIGGNKGHSGVVNLCAAGTLITNAAIYDAELTKAQVNNAMNNSYDNLTSADKTNLRHWWDFGGQVGSDGSTGYTTSTFNLDYLRDRVTGTLGVLGG